MLIDYSNDNQRKLADVLKNAVGNMSNHVIPDLQRPYVWKPDQIILLVDSLFRRWPFGSILTWRVKTQSEQDEFGIPNRAFYRNVSRSDSLDSVEFGKTRPPATYTMVLDGQQRLQSLILALASEDSSFTMDAESWDSVDSEIRKGPITARLYIDFSLLKDSLNGKSVTKIVEANGIAPFLKWSDQYKSGYILLAKLWNETDGKETRSTDDWNEDEDVFEKYSINEDNKRTFAQLLYLIGTVRKDTIVPVLEIKAFGESESQRDSYNDAIVNIFTRLNTAGRTLSKEEITLAWLKSGWVTGRENAGRQLAELLDLINGKTSNLFEMDDLVRYLSFIWGVLANEGKLIESQDLLNGAKIKPIAKFISEKIEDITIATENALNIVEQSKVLEESSSKNSLITYMVWFYIIASDSRSNISGRVVDRTNAEKEFDEYCEQFLNRWVFTSQWSGEWNSNAQTFFLDLAKKLNEISKKISRDRSHDYLNLVKTTEQMLISDALKQKAKNRISTIAVRKRNQVSQYRSLLWIWHRLDKNRWENSTIQLKLPRKRTVKLEVDHTVAYKKWMEDFLIPQIALDNPGIPESALGGCFPHGFSTRSDAEAFINTLGNMSLLNKSFNSSKDKKDMKDFVDQIRDFQQNPALYSQWEAGLIFNSSLTSPSTASFDDIVKAIKDRDRLIREELLSFVDGSKIRCD